jgi:hypothetical protein
MVHQWVVEADGDPEAQLCRMRASLRAGAFDDARDDAIVAIQEAVDPLEMLGSVVRLCNEALAELPSLDSPSMQVLVRQFQALQNEGFAPAGSRR